MKKWTYVVFPVVMLAIFLTFYSAEKRRWDAAEAARILSEQKAKAADDARKAAAEAAARIAAKKRADDQKREEAAQEQARREKWDAETRGIQAVTDRANAEAAALNREASELEIEIDALRQQKEKLNREDFDLLKEVELARARQRTAELEIERLVAIISDRAEQSLAASKAGT